MAELERADWPDRRLPRQASASEFGSVQPRPVTSFSGAVSAETGSAANHRTAPTGEASPNGVATSRATLWETLVGQEPLPALAMDQQWNLLAANYMMEHIVGPIAPALLTPPINVLRVVLHPKGLARRLDNLPEVRSHLMRRLRRQISRTSDASLVGLERELMSYGGPREDLARPAPPPPIAFPVRLRVGRIPLNLISTSVAFGTPWDATLSEATAEFLLPADQTARVFLFRRPVHKTGRRSAER